MEANRKSKPRYLGPYQVYRHTRGGSYVLQELDGAIWRQPVAAFRLLPYISRDDPVLEDLMQDPDEEPPLAPDEERDIEDSHHSSSRSHSPSISEASSDLSYL